MRIFIPVISKHRLAIKIKNFFFLLQVAEMLFLKVNQRGSLLLEGNTYTLIHLFEFLLKTTLQISVKT